MSTPQIYTVYDRTDRNRGSKKPVAIALSEARAQAEVELLRKNVPEHARALVYFLSPACDDIRILA